MAKKDKNKGRFKVQLNKVILQELRNRGMKYVNMDQAISDLCKVIGVGIRPANPLETRIRLVTLLTGKEPVNDWESFRANHVAKYGKTNIASYPKPAKPKYLPGVPSASTLERDIKEFYASWEWKKLSFSIKQERGRRCECCGAKAPAVVIHTDHIKPIRHYWHLRLERTNL